MLLNPKIGRGFVAAAVLACSAAGPAVGQETLRSWSPDVTIGMRRVLDNPTNIPVLAQSWRTAAGKDSFVFSAKGDRVFFVTRRGDLSDDSNLYVLEVYSVDRIRSALLTPAIAGRPRIPEPLARALISTQSSFNAGISKARWQDDGEAIFFLGAPGASLPQVYRLDMATTIVTQMTAVPEGVASFIASGKGVMSFQYDTSPHPQQYPMAMLSGWPPLAPGQAPSRRTVYATYRGSGSQMIRGELEFLSLSPDGRFAIVRSKAGLAKLDLKNAHVVPVQPSSPAAKSDAKPRACIESIGSTASPIVRWLGTAGQVQIRCPDGGATRVIDHRRGESLGGRVNKAANLQGPAPIPLRAIQLTLKQTANDPPIVVASDGARTIALEGSDPVLSGVKYAPVEAFTWKEDGVVRTGGIRLPDGHAGASLPLVIQIDDHALDMFAPDGGEPNSATAAQMLVANGIAVAHVPDEGIKVGTSEEGPAFVARIDAVVDALVARYAIDRRRIGLMGFSRNGFRTLWTITHPGKTKLAAVVCADNFMGSFPGYLLEAGRFGTVSSYEPMYGGNFWQNKELWLRQETLFNVDRIETPALFTLNGHLSDPQEALYVVGAFRANRKPFDFRIFPDATHVLQRPREIEASMNSIVDWMLFWLKGEAYGSTRSEQYSRWREMRKQLQQAGLSDSPVSPNQ